MAGMRHDDDDIISSINVTPLVDIMLVLLIIFMLVSTFVAKEAIEVELPHAATGGEVKTESLAIVISKDGEFFLAGKKQEDFQELMNEVKKVKDSGSDIQVIISADKKAYHENLVKVIDGIRKLEIFKFAINVEYMEN